PSGTGANDDGSYQYLPGPRPPIFLIGPIWSMVWKLPICFKLLLSPYNVLGCPLVVPDPIDLPASQHCPRHRIGGSERVSLAEGQLPNVGQAENMPVVEIRHSAGVLL